MLVEEHTIPFHLGLSQRDWGWTLTIEGSPEQTGVGTGWPWQLTLEALFMGLGQVLSASRSYKLQEAWELVLLLPSDPKYEMAKLFMTILFQQVGPEGDQVAAPLMWGGGLGLSDCPGLRDAEVGSFCSH